MYTYAVCGLELFVLTMMQPPCLLFQALDIWSLGVTLYCFLFGRVPFNKDMKIALYHSIVNDPVVYPER